MIDKFRSDLTELSKTYFFGLFYGMTGSDEQIGECTFIGPKGNSVIDYGIYVVLTYTSVQNILKSLRVQNLVTRHSLLHIIRKTCPCNVYPLNPTFI